MKTERVGYYYIFVVIQNSLEKPNIYKYFVVHSALMIQSLLGSEKKPDVYDLAIADGIKEMLVMHGFTRDKILNTMVSNLAETLHSAYYLQLGKNNVGSISMF